MNPCTDQVALDRAYDHSNCHSRVAWDVVALSSFRISDTVSLHLHALVLLLELDFAHSAGCEMLLVLNAGAVLVSDSEKVSDARNLH